MSGQPQVSPVLRFDVTNITITSAGLPPSVILDRNLQWQVTARFEFADLLALPLVAIPLTWTYRAVAESMGPGPEVVLGNASGSTSAGQLVYTPTITVPSNTLPAGVYRVTGLIQITGPGGAFPILGFNETVIQAAEVA